MSSEHSLQSDSRLLPSRFQATSSRNQSKRFSAQNEDLTHVAEEKVINLRICPVCYLEISKKPMTPSNYAPTNNSIFPEQELDKKNNPCNTEEESSIMV